VKSDAQSVWVISLVVMLSLIATGLVLSIAFDMDDEIYASEVLATPPVSANAPELMDSGPSVAEQMPEILYDAETQ
jgi:hypothetical protein